MKNFWKILGIIALIAVIGFSMAACKDDDDDTPPPAGETPAGGTPAGGGGGELPSGAVTGITVDSALVGTWIGDEENGTLVFTADGVGSPDGIETAAGSFVAAVGQIKIAYAAAGATIAIKQGNVSVTIYGSDVKLMAYTISGSTLTIYESEEPDDDEILFVGTK